MKEKKLTEHQIEELLNSMDNAERATPGPYFFTRLQARLQEHFLHQKRSAWEKISSWISKPSIAFGSLLLVILLNLAVLFHKPNKAERFEELNDDYTTASTTTFDYENPDSE